MRLGETVHPGQTLLTLGGPLLAPGLANARAGVQSAAKKLRLVGDVAASIQRLYPKFANRAVLDQTLGKVVSAEVALSTAQAQLARLLGISQVHAHLPGRVMALAVTVGMDLQAGARLIQIVPEQGVLLHAEFFPLGWTPAIGTSGWFHPLQGGKPRAVIVTAVSPGFDVDGARELWLAPAQGQGSHGLISGESGRVVLRASVRAAVQVPVEALVLDRSRWWVMLDNHGKLRARSVRLAADGTITGVIVQGLKPGERVVVRDSYRLFHRDFSQHYMPPD